MISTVSLENPSSLEKINKQNIFAFVLLSYRGFKFSEHLTYFPDFVYNYRTFKQSFARFALNNMLGWLKKLMLVLPLKIGDCC